MVTKVDPIRALILDYFKMSDELVQLSGVEISQENLERRSDILKCLDRLEELDNTIAALEKELDIEPD